MENNINQKILNEMKPYIKEMVEEIVAESFRKGEMRELFEDLILAKNMEKAETEENLSVDEAVKQLKWK